MTTECVRLPLLSGRALDEPTSDDGQLWQACVREVSQQPGCQRLFWGREVENPSMLRLFADWDSIEAHNQFRASPGFEAFRTKLATICEVDKIVIFHVSFSPFPATAALSNQNSPVSEVINVFFPDDYSTEDQKTFDANIRKFVAVIEANSSAFRASTGGFAHELVEIPDLGGLKGKVFVGVIGWNSVDEHHAFTETQVYKDNIHLLTAAKDLRGVVLTHSSHVMVMKN